MYKHVFASCTSTFASLITKLHEPYTLHLICTVRADMLEEYNKVSTSCHHLFQLQTQNPSELATFHPCQGFI